PGLILSAPASGQGKTTVALGLLRALARRGVRVVPAKAGPDFIDPGFHAVAAGRASLNLDDWGMRNATLAGAVAAAGAGAELVLCEGAMGLFDGAPGGGGSTADIAARTGWPVVLVVDVFAQGQSVAALVDGFARWRPDVRIAGCILNRVGGPGHLRLATEALAATSIPVLGGLTVARDIALPERHLGLVLAEELPTLDRIVERIAERIAAAVDLDALRALARPSSLPTGATGVAVPPPNRLLSARPRPFPLHPQIHQPQHPSRQQLLCALASHHQPRRQPQSLCSWSKRLVRRLLVGRYMLSNVAIPYRRLHCVL
ncbi:MAG: cobyrinate a,c-diamide synthase, partial [Anaerolineales bacterium]|nr:cobyrinate a,c-diamide synthase [Anaerolineales bacterium]